ncbi:MAG: hypothetical protein JXN65_00250 [Clostridia bacterium]|nr:hypothetical protein [Clostridia bacterium]
MKKIRILILILCLLLLASCDIGKVNRFSVGNNVNVEKSTKDIQNSNNNIVMTILENTLTTNGANLSIRNEGNQDISFGSQYFIQVLIDDSWYDIIIPQVDWTMELITLEPGQEQTFELNWSSVYGNLSTGTYRIVKEYRAESVSSYVFCEFEIN